MGDLIVLVAPIDVPAEPSTLRRGLRSLIDPISVNRLNNLRGRSRAGVPDNHTPTVSQTWLRVVIHPNRGPEVVPRVSEGVGDPVLPSAEAGVIRVGAGASDTVSAAGGPASPQTGLPGGLEVPDHWSWVSLRLGERVDVVSLHDEVLPRLVRSLGRSLVDVALLRCLAGLGVDWPRWGLGAVEGLLRARGVLGRGSAVLWGVGAGGEGREMALVVWGEPTSLSGSSVVLGSVVRVSWQVAGGWLSVLVECHCSLLIYLFFFNCSVSVIKGL